jgi:hypothetical protein
MKLRGIVWDLKDQSAKPRRFTNFFNWHLLERGAFVLRAGHSIYFRYGSNVNMQR